MHSFGLLRFFLNCLYYVLWALFYFFGYHLMLVMPAFALCSLIYGSTQAIALCKNTGSRRRNQLIPSSICFVLSAVVYGIVRFILFTLCEATWTHVFDFVILEIFCMAVFSGLLFIVYFFHQYIYLKWLKHSY